MLKKPYLHLSDESGPAFKEVLSTSVKPKTLTEEERKAMKVEQKDFRFNLVRKVGELLSYLSLRLNSKYIGVYCGVNDRLYDIPAITWHRLINMARNQMLFTCWDNIIILQLNQITLQFIPSN